MNRECIPEWQLGWAHVQRHMSRDTYVQALLFIFIFINSIPSTSQDRMKTDLYRVVQLLPRAPCFQECSPGLPSGREVKGKKSSKDLSNKAKGQLGDWFIGCIGCRDKVSGCRMAAG